MNLYEMWFDRGPGASDAELVSAIHNWLNFLRDRGEIESFRLTRRKFGFGPAGMGEFHVTVETKTLDQLDQAFMTAASRFGEIESLHVEVYSRVTNYSSALYRDYPDDVLGKPPRQV